MVCLLLEDVTSTTGGDYGSCALQRGIDRDNHRGAARGRRHQPQLLVLIEQLLEDDTDAGAARVTRLPNTLFAPFLHVLLFYDL